MEGVIGMLGGFMRNGCGCVQEDGNSSLSPVKVEGA